MVQWANITPNVVADGVAYCSGAAVPTANADTDLGTPVVVPPWAVGVEADVALAVTGTPGTQTTYVVMQGDYGDGNWVDLAWCLSTATSGTDVFLLSARSAAGLGLRQTRTAGSAPASTGQNAGPLPPRVRFASKGALSGLAVAATVKYRWVGAR